jgi:hypothetical protein
MDSVQDFARIKILKQQNMQEKKDPKKRKRENLRAMETFTDRGPAAESVRVVGKTDFFVCPIF